MAIVKKISELTPKGSALGTTDLLVVGVDNGTDYDLKSVTGAQLLGTVVSQTITDGVTTKAPSENVVYDNLALKVDKVAGSRLITTAEGTILSNTSGTNTGDETVTTIKTKLGVSTLSGSNTGDQDLSGYQPLLSNGTTNRLTKWSSSSAITNSLIQDNGTTLSIGTTPVVNNLLKVSSNATEATILTENSQSSGVGILGSASGSNGIGASFTATSSTGVKVGVNGSATGAGGTNKGGVFSSIGGVNNYSIQLTDGTQGSGKFLKDVTGNGEANWSNIANTDVSGLGSLATQSGTFSGTSSGTNTGDQIISDATITTTDITTNNFSTTKHGFVPKGTNVGNFLKDDGTWGDVSMPSGVFGISNSSGVYTYYTTLTLAMAAATSGKTITFFTDITETSNVEIILKDGVDINFNGYTYTLNTSGTANCFLANIANGTTRFYNGKIQRIGGISSNLNSCVIFVNNVATAVYNLDFNGVEIYSSFGVGISGTSNTVPKINGVKLRTFSHGCYFETGVQINNSFIETFGGGVGCYSKTITNSYVITTGGGNAIAFPYSGRASNCYASVSGVGSGRAISCASGVTVTNCTAISTRNSAVYNFAAEAILTYAYSTANCGFEGGSNGGGNATNCYSYTTATQAYLYNGNVSNCYGISTASAALRGINGGIVTNVYNSSMTATVAVVMDNFKNAFGNTIISTYNNAAGHAVTPLAVSILSNNTLMVTNASANCIYNAGAVSSKWANNTFVGSTTAVSANSTQLVTNTHDNQGNILM